MLRDTPLPQERFNRYWSIAAVTAVGRLRQGSPLMSRPRRIDAYPVKQTEALAAGVL
jgi:hypothetical protein